MRLLITVVALLGMAACATQHEAPWQEITTADPSIPPSLAGRWRSDTAPTGWWIIDRHADGRYASKFYLCHDLSKPHEVAFEWGRWVTDGKTYRHIIDGTNSEVLRPFIGKWREWSVISQTHNRFDFTVNDGPRHEQRISATASLPDLKLPFPQDNSHGVNVPSLASIPDWVRSKPL